MTRPYIERRNKQVLWLYHERRKQPKRIAVLMGITVWAVYKILKLYNFPNFSKSIPVKKEQ